MKCIAVHGSQGGHHLYYEASLHDYGVQNLFLGIVCTMEVLTFKCFDWLKLENILKLASYLDK